MDDQHNTIRVIDTETTGFPPEASMVEIAWTDVVRDGEGWALGETFSSLLKPKHPISFQAMAIHHITEDMVSDAPLLGEIEQPAAGCDVLSAHNADFDKKFYNVKTRPWLCTLKCARRVWPDAPSHSNGVLRYYLGLEFDDYDRTLPAHRAGPDTYVTATLLLELLKHEDMETLLRWSDGLSLLPRLNFGKHRGMKFEEAPADYLDWLVNNQNMDRDVRATARYWIKQRKDKN